ncbi:uncharacterized protein LOC142585099 isoform X2 [Dermacentor variabilis]|uniref:uncharacterized protein LOC142585099 isoform X2 n=1 Tax=Dermacentor variabilis TaxID=34621 RepID=UPI003F5B203D
MSRVEPEKVKQSGSPRGDSEWVEFALDDTGPGPSQEGSPSQVQNKVDEPVQHRMPLINVSNGNVYHQTITDSTVHQNYTPITPYRTARDRSPINERRAGNSRRRTEITEYPRRWTTGRGNMEERTSERERTARRWEHDRYDPGYGHGSHRGTPRRRQEVLRERITRARNSPRRQY